MSQEIVLFGCSFWMSTFWGPQILTQQELAVVQREIDKFLKDSEKEAGPCWAKIRKDNEG